MNYRTHLHFCLMEELYKKSNALDMTFCSRYNNTIEMPITQEKQHEPTVHHLPHDRIHRR